MDQGREGIADQPSRCSSSRLEVPWRARAVRSCSRGSPRGSCARSASPTRSSSIPPHSSGEPWVGPTRSPSSRACPWLWSELVTNWSLTAFLVGGLCVLLAMIFSSLTSVMPRSGGDYVFTSRIVPRVGPLLGWLESWGLVFACIALLQFETVQVIRSFQIQGRIIGIGTGSDFFNNATSWFTEGGTGDVTGFPGLVVALLVFAPGRRDRRPADQDLPQDRDLPHGPGDRGLDPDGRVRSALLRPERVRREPPQVCQRDHRRPADRRGVERQA